mmetsp:Transcript_222/g.517  ORF Transcript_222/g.517 Transcript_222/m.517 type:complete len:298 (-) Transcript_222:236-1129(-)
MFSAVHDAAWTLFLSFRLGSVDEAGSRAGYLLHVTEAQPNNEWTSAVLSQHELPPKEPGTIRLVLVSDTHERHKGLCLPPCDAVLHSGDILASSRWAPRVHAEDVLRDFGDWLRSTNCSARFVIAGNHDHWVEELGAETVQTLLGEGVQYLEFSSASFLVSDPEAASPVEVSVFGAPVSAGKSPNRAFQHEEALRRLEDAAPPTCDILLTHGPLLTGKKKGLPAVAKLLERLQPALHACGHVHGRYGTVQRMADFVPATGVSINASIMRSLGKLQGQRPLNAPIVCDLRLPSSTVCT